MTHRIDLLKSLLAKRREALANNQPTLAGVYSKLFCKQLIELRREVKITRRELKLLLGLQHHKHTLTELASPLQAALRRKAKAEADCKPAVAHAYGLLTTKHLTRLSEKTKMSPQQIMLVVVPTYEV